MPRKYRGSWKARRPTIKMTRIPLTKSYAVSAKPYKKKSRVIGVYSKSGAKSKIKSMKKTGLVK